MIVTVRNEVAKVMFLQVCVCVTCSRSPGGGVVSQQALQGGGIPACLAGGCLVRGVVVETPPPADGYCGGRYASYRNAFLFLTFMFVLGIHSFRSGYYLLSDVKLSISPACSVCFQTDVIKLLLPGRLRLCYTYK